MEIGSMLVHTEQKEAEQRKNILSGVQTTRAHITLQLGTFSI